MFSELRRERRGARRQARDDRDAVAEAEEEQLPPIGEWIQPTIADRHGRDSRSRNGNGNGNGHAKPQAAASRISEPVPGLAVPRSRESRSIVDDSKSTDRYGIVVFCHLRWGFVWQRPQQFLSRFAKKHPILFIEEPFFDLKPKAPSRASTATA